MIFDYTDIPKEKAHTKQQRYPRYSSNQIISKKFFVLHFSYSGDKRCKRPDNGDKPRDGDGFSSVTFKERLRPVNVFRLNERNMLSLLDFFPQQMTDVVVYSITGDGGHIKEKKDQRDRNRASGRSNCADGENQRISRQERSDNQPGFYKDNDKYNYIGQHIILAQQSIQIGVQMEKKIHDKGKVHFLCPPCFD